MTNYEEARFKLTNTLLNKLKSGVKIIQNYISIIPIMRYSITPHNIFRIQDDDYLMGGFYYTTSIEYMLAGKLSPNKYKKNG